MTIEIATFDETHPLWANYLKHLERVQMSRWALLDHGAYNLDYYYLGALNDDRQVIGHLSLTVQPLDLPVEWSLTEAFVNTFAVEPEYRRQGYGRALQREALRLSAALHCYQLRSWSALDHPENYALKLQLGFCVHPTEIETENGEKIRGVYFVKTVDVVADD